MMREQSLRGALWLREENNYIESNQILNQLANTYPEDAYIHYQCAWSYDALGEEAKAVPHYEKALQGGLDASDLENAYLGLGSTYRALGDYQSSKRVFVEALNHFPENHALKSFYAMTLYNIGESHDAVQLLLKTLVATTTNDEIRKYKKTLAFYADHLDDKWS